MPPQAATSPAIPCQRTAVQASLDELTLPANSNDSGDPVLGRNNGTGAVYLSTIASSNSPQIDFFTSNNNGATFGAPVNAAPGFTAGDSLDKEWMGVDNFTGTGQGNIYLTFTDFNGPPPNGIPRGIYFTRSTNGGQTWGPNGGVQMVASQAVGGSYVTVGPNHTVYVFWLQGIGGGGDQIRMRTSVDGGQTFGTTNTVATLNVATSNGDLGLEFRSNSFPQAAVTTNNSVTSIFVAYNDSATGDRGNIYLAQSTNGGTSWQTTKVNTDTGTTDQFFPSLAVSPDGSHVFVGYYSRENDPANLSINTFGRIAAVNGGTLTWGPAFRISDHAFPSVTPYSGFGDPSVAILYMGDYNSAAADNQFFYYSWGDNREASASGYLQQQNVRFARIPVGGPAGPMVIGGTPSLSSTFGWNSGSTYGGGVMRGPISSISVTFNQPMNTASFTVAGSVDAFTGPDGTDLRGRISNTVSWSNNNQTLTLSLTQSLTTGGIYTLTIGPNILSATGAAMDQNENGTAGETTADRFDDFFTIAGTDIIAKGTGSYEGQFWVNRSIGLTNPLQNNPFNTFATTEWAAFSSAIAWTNVLVGDFNGDGFSDIAAQIPHGVAGAGAWYVALSDGSSAFLPAKLWSTSFSASVNWSNAFTGDFNNDGMTDILVRDPASGYFYMATSNGSSFVMANGGLGVAYFDPSKTWDFAVADFNHDGKADILGRNNNVWNVGISSGSTFTVSTWATWSSTVTLGNTLVGDFNNDGLADIVARDQTTGWFYMALSSGSAFNLVSTQGVVYYSPSITWSFSLGDPDHNSEADIIGLGVTSGGQNFSQWWVALSSGASFNTATWWGTWSIAVTWINAMAADFNGDGNTDVVARDSGSGLLWVGLSNGSSAFNPGTVSWGGYSTGVTWSYMQLGNFSTGGGIPTGPGRFLKPQILGGANTQAMPGLTTPRSEVIGSPSNVLFPMLSGSSISSGAVSGVDAGLIDASKGIVPNEQPTWENPHVQQGLSGLSLNGSTRQSIWELETGMTLAVLQQEKDFDALIAPLALIE